MQGSKSNFFAKSEKRARFDDGYGSGNGGNSKKFMDRNKQARRQANRQQSREDKAQNY